MRLVPGALLLLAACADTRIAPSWPGSHLLVAEAGTRSLAVIEPNGGLTRHRFDAEGEPVALAVARNGEYAATITAAGHLVVHDLARERRDGAFDLALPGRASAIVFADRRSTLLVGCEGSGDVLAVGRSSGRIEKRIATGLTGIRALQLAPGVDAIAALGAGRGQLVRIDPGSLTADARPALGGEVHSLAFAQDGGRTWFTLAGSDRVGMAGGPDSGGDLIAVGPPPLGVATSFDGAIAAVACPALGEVALIEAASRSVVRRVAVGGAEAGSGVAWPVLVDPDGRHAFVALPSEARVVVVDLAARRVRGEYRTGARPIALAFAFQRPDVGDALLPDPGDR